MPSHTKSTSESQMTPSSGKLSHFQLLNLPGSERMIFTSRYWWQILGPFQIKCKKIMFQFYVMWLHLFFNILLPLAVLAFFNRAIYTKLHQVENYQCLMIGTFTLQFPERLSAVSHGSTNNLNPNNVSNFPNLN